MKKWLDDLWGLTLLAGLLLWIASAIWLPVMLIILVWLLFT